MALKILDHHNLVQHLVPFLWSHRLNMIDKGMGVVGWGFRCVIVLFFCGVVLTLFFILIVSRRRLYIFFLLFSSIRAIRFNVLGVRIRSIVLRPCVCVVQRCLL